MARVLVDHIKSDGDWCECGRQWISFEVSLLNLTKRGCRPQCLSCVCRQTPLIAQTTTRRDAMAIRYRYSELHGTRDSHQIWEQQRQQEEEPLWQQLRQIAREKNGSAFPLGRAFRFRGHTQSSLTKLDSRQQQQQPHLHPTTCVLL